MNQEELEKANIIAGQIRETVAQDKAGVTARLVCITCPCGWKRSIYYTFQCLYCNVWFCKNCAEVHFGKTVEEYKSEKLNES